MRETFTFTTGAASFAVPSPDLPDLLERIGEQRATVQAALDAGDRAAYPLPQGAFDALLDARAGQEREALGDA